MTHNMTRKTTSNTPRKPKKAGGPWIVLVQGSHKDSSGHEISVVHSDYTLGRDSWGLDGPNKLVVSEDTDCTRSQFDEAKRRAQIIADAYNAAGVPFTK